MSVQPKNALPSWVEADPLRSRAVDALGLQAVADRIADELLPGLSVLTTRARYYSFLCWARRACGGRADETKIHRLEVALSLREAQLSLHDDEHRDGCRFVGSRSLTGRELPASVPRDPRSIYKVPAWRGYRASMVNLGLIDEGDALTDFGDRAAKAFSARCKPDTSGRRVLPNSACLNRTSRSEYRILVDRLGVLRLGRAPSDDTDVARRDALWREISWAFEPAKGFWAAHLLGAYETKRPRRASPTFRALREAAVWERISFGLGLIFLAWLHAIEIGGRKPTVLQRRFRLMRGKTRHEPSDFVELESTSFEDSEQLLRDACASIRTGLALADYLGDDEIPNLDKAVLELARAAVGRTQVDLVFRALEERHLAMKADDAWIRRTSSGRIEIARNPGDDKWALPSRVRLHPYRLWAFGQIMVDLWRAR